MWYRVILVRATSSEHGCASMIGNWHISFLDGVIKWKHFLRYWPFVWGIHRSPVNSLHKGQWRRTLMFSLICAWINGWVNNREAGDLRRHRPHYDVIVMFIGSFFGRLHDTRWRHGTLSALLAFCEGNPLVTGELPTQTTAMLYWYPEQTVEQTVIMLMPL